MDKKAEELKSEISRHQSELNRLKAEAQVALEKSVAELRVISDKIEKLKEVGYDLKASIVSLRKTLSEYEEGKPSIFAVVIDLMKGGVKTLAELCEASGLSAAQVSQFLQNSHQKKMVQKSPPRRGIKGVSYLWVGDGSPLRGTPPDPTSKRTLKRQREERLRRHIALVARDQSHQERQE